MLPSHIPTSLRLATATRPDPMTLSRVTSTTPLLITFPPTSLNVVPDNRSTVSDEGMGMILKTGVERSTVDISVEVFRFVMDRVVGVDV